MNSIILGFDAFDPNIFEALSNQGKMPNLSQYLDSGDYARFDVSNPAQSEVSWTSIATGLNPGGHGLFDFVHRNPANYSLHVSMLPTKKGQEGPARDPIHETLHCEDHL
jgi:predicted AlkP superfamily phosphohydrolase/phosphomutase